MEISKKLIVAIVVAVLAIITFFASFRVVETGETGVLVRFGQVQDTTLTSGIHFVIPFVDSVKKVNNKQVDFTYGGQVWAESSEQTPVYYEGVTISYTISPNASVWLYSNVDRNIINDTSTLVPATLVSSAIKNASATLTTREVTKRASIEPLATMELQESLNEKYGDNTITVVKLSISNADFEDAYNAVIAERQSAQIKQEQQEIENKTAIAKAEADAEAARLTAQGTADAQKIQAEAEAEMAIIEANAKAEAIKVEADARAEANQKLQESLTDEVLTHDYIEKWNGELPKVSSDGSLMFDVSGMTE